MAPKTTYRWLGQAGFLITTGSGLRIAIDPYLSDDVERGGGPRRAVRPPVAPDGLEVEILLITHAHGDHFDSPVVAHVATCGATLVAPPGVVERALTHGWSKDSCIALVAGQSATVDGLAIHATFARHEAPDVPPSETVGFLIVADSHRIWHSGDTEYDARLRHGLGALDLALIVINGTGGNMNAYEAALLVAQIEPRFVVPMHYGLWDAAGYGFNHCGPPTLDPEIFRRTLERLGSSAATMVPDLGLELVLP